MSKTIEVKRKKPGRKPIYDYEKYGIAGVEKSKYSVIITVRLPIYAINRLDRWIKEGTYQNRSRAIHDLIMKSDEETLKELGKLKRKLEVLEAENEALRNKIKLLEEEKKALAEKYHELLKEHEETVNELLELKAKFSQSEGKEQDKVDWKEEVLELVKEYLKAKERETSARLPGERRDAFEEAQKLFRRIQSILEERNVNKTVFWRLVNKGDFDKVKQFLEGY